ncbi:LysR substrate-binding domain-containing protein, partial [Pseudomonas aeruginosa]|uniref:LysR substrate-binding domain-containing protein n=1 Tax=Pseudomonas aeruginosa TaxID=287 RepID=UPI003F56A4E1
MAREEDEVFVAQFGEVQTRLAGQARLDLAELRDEDFILFPRHVSPHYHDLIIARCVDAGFSTRIRHEARLWQTVAAMVGLGMGVALISSLTHIS